VVNPAPFSATPPGSIGVVEPIEPALERTKNLLFRPFNLQKWFIIGFSAWLAQLGQNGGPTGGFGFPGGNLEQMFERAKEFVMSNLGWLIPLAIFLFVLFFCLGLAIIWLNSRGQFMFLHCIVLDKQEIAEPWKMYAAPANSLFIFRVCLSLTSFAISLSLLGLGAYFMFKLVHQRQEDPISIVALLLLVPLFTAVILLFAIVHKLTADFVVPIMYLRRNTCVDAWKELWTLISARIGKFVLYFLFQFVLGMVIGSLVMAVILVTCCLAFCLMAVPYLGAVVMLPVSTFKRYYSLHFLAQFGPEYNVFPPAAAATSSNAPFRAY
jgi:hypothetical protein